ncbi:hypothetical protein Tco_0225637, partial [Tanacetum coccineum]
VGDEAINEEMFDNVERAATTASSLEAEQASSNINKSQFMTTLNEPFFLELSSSSYPWRQDTIGVFDLENVKTAQAKEIVGLKRRVTKLEQRQRSRIIHSDLVPPGDRV